MIWMPAAVVDRRKSLRRRGESYSDVILWAKLWRRLRLSSASITSSSPTRQKPEKALIISVALLSVADYAQAVDLIDVRQSRVRLEQVLIVSLAPAAKPSHHGWCSFLAARLPAAWASASHMYSPRFVFP
jgi:hypothetical protein